MSYEKIIVRGSADLAGFVGVELKYISREFRHTSERCHLNLLMIPEHLLIDESQEK